MVGGVDWIVTLELPMIVIGSAYLVWMAVGLLRDDGVTARPDFLRAPSF